MESNAYELERFAPREQQAQIRVAKTEQKTLRRASLRGVKIAALICIMLALICSLLYSKSITTELARNINLTEQEIVEAKSEYAYLSNEMELKANIKNIEQRAAELGLVKMSPSQITYVTVTKENKLVVAQNSAKIAFENVKSGFLSFMEYMAP